MKLFEHLLNGSDKVPYVLRAAIMLTLFIILAKFATFDQTIIVLLLFILVYLTGLYLVGRFYNLKKK